MFFPLLLTPDKISDPKLLLNPEHASLMSQKPWQSIIKYQFFDPKRTQ